MLRNSIRKARKAGSISAAREDGFTLIELLIVIVILGVLAGIVVFSVRGVTDTGKAAACQADLKTVQTASEAYYAKNTAYAADMAALVTAGFLQSVSTKVTYAPTGGTPATTPAIAIIAAQC